MSVDVHPSGQKIVFDLLGDLYELPIQGGKATRITEGLAFDSQPKYSPDGNSILFLSDRSGGNNVWIIDRNEEDTLQVTKGNTSKMQSADWSPDGDYIAVSKGTRNFKLHLYHKDGGEGSQLISEPERLKISEPTFSADGQLIWFSERMGAWQYNAKLPQYQLAIYDREDGKKEVMFNFKNELRNTSKIEIPTKKDPKYKLLCKLSFEGFNKFNVLIIFLQLQF